MILTYLPNYTNLLITCDNNFSTYDLFTCTYLSIYPMTTYLPIIPTFLSMIPTYQINLPFHDTSQPTYDTNQPTYDTKDCYGWQSNTLYPEAPDLVLTNFITNIFRSFFHHSTVAHWLGKLVSLIAESVNIRNQAGAELSQAQASFPAKPLI